LNTESVNNNLLVEELQLGEQLNHCVHSNRRSDFGLMLSMLTDDVLAYSQFKLPKTTHLPLEKTDELLRKEFQLPPKQRLAIESLDEINSLPQAQLVADNLFTDIHLNEALSPSPLAFRDDKKHIDSMVLSNTTLYCQQQYNNKNKTEALENSRLAFNVNAWLKTVQTTIAKALLLAVNA